MGLSKISIWRGEMDMQKSIKSLKRNGILLLAYDLLVLCIVFVKNGMINMSAEAVTSLIWQLKSESRYTKSQPKS